MLRLRDHHNAASATRLVSQPVIAEEWKKDNLKLADRFELKETGSPYLTFPPKFAVYALED